MNQIVEQELRDAMIASKKDAKLVAVARNERTSSASSMYKEFEKLPVERQREIIISVCAEYFVAAQWKIAFPLNNFSPEVLPFAVSAAGKALFFSREEDSVRETVRAIKIYQDTPYCKQIASLLGEAAEVVGAGLSSVAEILTAPEIYGIVKSLDPALASTEKIVSVIGKTTSYARDLSATEAVARFLFARRHSVNIGELCSLVENAVFLARDRRSIQQIIAGFTSGSIDVVLQRAVGNHKILSAIRDVAWKTKDSRAIRDHLTSFL